MTLSPATLPSLLPAFAPVSADDDLPGWAVPEDAGPGTIGRALADTSFVGEVWPRGQRAWLRVGDGESRLVVDGGGSPRAARAAALLADAAAQAGLRTLGCAVLDVVIVGHGSVRLDVVDLVLLDGERLGALPYAIRAVALADLLERLRESSPGGATGFLRPARAPRTGSEKRRLAGGREPLRMVLRDLRLPYGMAGAVLRVPSPVAGFFDDPWRDELDPS